jgi:hypothetical protein
VTQTRKVSKCGQAEGQQLTEASGMSASWVRKYLRQAGLVVPVKARKKTSFTTGQEPLPGVTAESDVNP